MNSGPVIAIGIDVGGTKIAGGLVETATGIVRARRQQPTSPERGGEAVFADVLQQAEALAAEGRGLGVTVAGIGVGLPQLVTSDGAVRSAHLFDWRRIPTVDRLGHIAPARLQSDVRAAAQAEAKFGAGAGHRLFCYITIGTGMSYCMVQDGAPFTGARGYAIHFASMPQWSRCVACGRVHDEVLEEVAAGPGIARADAKRRGGQVRRTEDVLAAASSGDPDAVAVAADAAMAAGAAIGQMVNMMDPTALVIGGGVGVAGGFYGERLAAAIRSHIFAPDVRDLPILPAALGLDAGIVGAALAAIG
jgi:glucokinase